jgi:hypothetical protein
MTEDKLDLQALLGKSADADFLREMIGFADGSCATPSIPSQALLADLARQSAAARSAGRSKRRMG